MSDKLSKALYLAISDPIANLKNDNSTQIDQESFLHSLNELENSIYEGVVSAVYTDEDIELEPFEDEKGIILVRDRYTKRPLQGITALTVTDGVEELLTLKIECIGHKKSN